MLKPGDIVRVIDRNEEGLLANIGFDLELHKTKYIVVINEDRVYITDEANLLFVSTLEEELEEAVKPVGNA